MPRERWFYVQGDHRSAAVSFSRLVEAVLAQPDPRSVLVWRKGFADWTRAEDVPQVEPHLASLVARKQAEASRAPAAAPSVPAPSPEAIREHAAGSPAVVYGGIAAGVVALALLAFLFWPRQASSPPTSVPLGGGTNGEAPAVVVPPTSAPETPAPPTPAPTAIATARPRPTSPPATAAPTTPLVAPGAMASEETDLPEGEVRRLRGVAAWSGNTLTLTVYNGTAWRVTELRVRIGRFAGDDFVEDPSPIVMLPPARRVDAGVAGLLDKVAPDRKKAGVNPLDTGPFEGEAGPRPESFRFQIESARGYAPRSSR